MTIEPLRHINVKGFNSVMFRRTYPEIIRPGGAWDEAMGIYPLVGGMPRSQGREFIFPTKARMGFGYLLNESALMGWKSAQIPLIMFDQLETFTERMFFYMTSRNRSSCGIRSYMRCTANPEPNWLGEFLSWWIAEDGYADMERAGKMRAFVRPGDDLVWADTKAELIEQYPALEPKTVTFIPFTIYDNPILMEIDPGYLASLQALPFVDRERLLGDRVRGGNWKIKPSAGKVFNADWFEIVDAIPEGGIACLYFDFAGTEKKALSHDPDFTAGVGMVYLDNYFVSNLFHQQLGASVMDARTDEFILNFVEDNLKHGRRVIVRWEIEPGSASLRDSAARVKRLTGIDARGVRKGEDKLTAWKPLAAQAEIGRVKVLKSAWAKSFIGQLHGVPELPHDDIADAAAGAFRALVSEIGGPKARSYQG